MLLLPPAYSVDAKGETLMMWTGGGTTANVRLNKAYKAENFSEVKIKLAVCVAGTATGYALTDTEKANAAGVVTTTSGNETAILTLDASKLANSDGYIEGFTFVTSEAGNNVADYVELVLAEEKEPTENVVVDMDTTQAWLEVDGEKMYCSSPR